MPDLFHGLYFVKYPLLLLPVPVLDLFDDVELFVDFGLDEDGAPEVALTYLPDLPVYVVSAVLLAWHLTNK